MTDELGLPLAELRSAVRPLQAIAPGLRLVVLFGSVPRGTARRDSDADIGVLGAEFWQQLQLGSAVAAELGREPHVVDLARVPEALAYEIARTGVALLEGEPFAWAQFQARAALRFFDFRVPRQRCVEGTRRQVLSEGARRAALG